MMSAEIEYTSQAIAHCPCCEDDWYDVDDSSTGEIKCETCGETFSWSTEH